MPVRHTSHPTFSHPTFITPPTTPPPPPPFRPRVVGSVDASLTISSSAGDLAYEIHAEAVANPYRLHPFVGTKIPAGVTYSRPIIMYVE